MCCMSDIMNPIIIVRNISRPASLQLENRIIMIIARAGKEKGTSKIIKDQITAHKSSVNLFEDMRPRPPQHTDANMLKRHSFTWISGISIKLMQSGYVDIRLTYSFKLFHLRMCANDFITNYLTNLRTSLYAIVISLFVYLDFQYSPIPKNRVPLAKLGAFRALQLFDQIEGLQGHKTLQIGEFQDPTILQIGEFLSP